MNRLQEDVIVSFTPKTSSVTLHEPIFVDLFIHNRLGEEIQFDLGHDRKSNLQFVITRPNGSIVRIPQLSKEDVSRIGKIVLGNRETYGQRLLLNQWYDFTTTGEYKIMGGLPNPVNESGGSC